MRDKVNMTIDAELKAEAKALGINMSKVAEDAIRQAAKVERNRRWREENREALEAYAREVEENGLAFPEYRTIKP